MKGLNTGSVKNAHTTSVVKLPVAKRRLKIIKINRHSRLCDNDQLLLLLHVSRESLSLDLIYTHFASVPLFYRVIVFTRRAFI